MKRPMLIAALCLVWMPLSVHAEEATVAQLADEAVAANPSLEAMRAKQRSLQARADTAGAWPDPMVSVEYSNVPLSSFSLSDHPMAGLQLRAQQTLRPPTWSRLKRQIGGLRAEATGFAVAEAALQLRAAVQHTWWLLLRSRLLEQVTRTHLARTEDLLVVARSRYETGAIGQHAVLRLEVRRDKMADEIGDFARTERELTAALSAALGRAPGGSFPTPTEVQAVAPPTEPNWGALAQEHRPALLRIASELQAAEQSAVLARVDAFPDLSVWAGYRIRTIETEMDPGTDLVAIGLGVPIPTGSIRRAGGERAAALEDAHAARFSSKATIDGIHADIESFLARWHRAWDKVATYDERLIPGARATVETTTADFSVGRAGFAALFEAEVALLDLERTRIAAAVETHVQLAQAEAVIGFAPPGGTQ